MPKAARASTEDASRSSRPAPVGPVLVSREEALRILRVKPATLYTYVSRGWIRSVPSGKGRRHGFVREDLERVRARASARAHGSARAEAALRFGDPVVSTRITEITPEGPRYRNRLAIDLAATGSSFEAVAVLLWTGAWTDAHLTWEALPSQLEHDDVARLLRAPAEFSDEIVKVLAAAVLWHGIRTHSTEELRRGDTMQAARAILQLMCGCLGFLSPSRRYEPVAPSQPLAASIARMFGGEASERTCHAINAMMVLCADYELTPANFTARVTASAGADLHACVAAGLCTHSGALTGQVCGKLEELLLEILPRQGWQPALNSVRRFGLTLYGFNPILTPHGDPRAYWMLRLAKEIKPRSRCADKALWFLDRVQEEAGMYPGLQAGLIALQIALQLPRKTALALWAIARTAGQIAHVIEQRSFGYILRPRARYIAD